MTLKLPKVLERVVHDHPGAFGKVKLVTVKASNKTYALKEIDKMRIKRSGMEKQVTNEIKIMYSIDHEHVIKLFNHFEDERNCYLLIEYAPKVNYCQTSGPTLLKVDEAAFQKARREN